MCTLPNWATGHPDTGIGGSDPSPSVQGGPDHGGRPGTEAFDEESLMNEQNHRGMHGTGQSSRSRGARDAIAVLALVVASLLLAPAAQAEPGARSILLVRHGHYLPDPNADEQLGPGISTLGVTQARLVGARLAGMRGQFDALYVSPLQRARDTAAVVGEEFPRRRFKVVDDLEECTPPTRREDITAGMPKEDLEACKAQLDRLFEHYFKPAKRGGRNEVFVCHGNVIRYLVTRALGVDSLAWLEMSVGHASITHIRVEADGSFKVIAIGDVGHMPPNLLTGASGDPQRSLDVPAGR